MTEHITNPLSIALNQACELIGIPDTRGQLRLIQEWLTVNYDVLTEAIGDNTYALAMQSIEGQLGTAAAHALSIAVIDEIWGWEDFANRAESPAELVHLHSVAFPARPLAEVLAPYTAKTKESAVAEADDTTPALVRAYTDIKCSNARGEQTTNSQHARLGRIVTELRSRGVLD